MESYLLKHLTGYIDGQWLNDDSTDSIAVFNPANGNEIAQVQAQHKEHVQQAIQAGRACLAHVPALETRRQWLLDCRDRLKAEKEEIGRILCLEHGKPLAEAEGEVEYAASFFDYFAGIMTTTLQPEELPEQAQDCSWTVYKRSVGVAGLITPWNFPIGMIAKKVAPALAAGCPIIIKPASETPLTMIAMFQLMDQHLDLPAGMINLVMGSASELAGQLMASPDVPLISFTGSTEVGKLLIEQSRDHVKKLSLELGGNAPFIVLDDADLDKAADNLIANKFRGSGQTCVCANRVYVQSSIYTEFSQKVIERARKLKAGDGMATDTDIGPLINADGFNKVKAHLSDALDKGARLEVGQSPEDLDPGQSLCFPPTVITQVSQDMQCCREETFGPLIPLIPFSEDKEAVTLANQTEFGLAAYVFGSDKQRAHQIIAKLHFGHCAYNTGTGPAAHAPFGGMLESGIGHEGGHEGLLEFTELQIVPDGS